MYTTQIKKQTGHPCLRKIRYWRKNSHYQKWRWKSRSILKYFSRVLTLGPDTELPNFEARNYKETLEDMDLTKGMVLNKLKKLMINKSSGPDAIHPTVQEIPESINTPITLTFKTSLKLREIPGQWKHASVRAIFKKRIKTKPQNHRPVRLTSIICKPFVSLKRDHMIEHINKKIY